LHLISSSNPSAPAFLAPRSSKGETFDWAAERSRIFAKLSPSLRASFARPTPGSKHPQGDVKGAGEGEAAHEVGETEWPKELPSAKEEKEADEEQKRLLALAEKK
jgi:tRNA-dihydrouridine synthase 2